MIHADAPYIDSVANTFSIAAYDPMENAWGIAVASRVLAVGAIVPWVRWNVGAIALQSLPRLEQAETGMALLEEGKSAQTTLNTILAEDNLRDVRQTGIVDAAGAVANFTGERCGEWAGAVAGENFTCQGNLLVGVGVLDAMAAAYTTTQGDFVERLWAALSAGNEAGGDKRGKQSAAIVVEKRHLYFYGVSTRFIDLRVDDHADPFGTLHAQIGKWRLNHHELARMLEPYGGVDAALEDQTLLDQAIMAQFFKD